MTNMTMNDMVLLSVDDHAIEPPDMFIGRLPERFKDMVPRVATYANGDERWIVEGKAWAGVGSAAVAGRKREELGDEPSRYGEVRRGCWDARGGAVPWARPGRFRAAAGAGRAV